MAKNGSDPEIHVAGARESSDSEDDEIIARQTPPAPLAAIGNRVSPAREGQPLPVPVRPIGAQRVANDIVNGQYDDVQLSPLAPTDEEEAAAHPLLDSLPRVRRDSDVELVNMLAEDTLRHLGYDTVSSDSESDSAVLKPASPLPRRSSPPPPAPQSGAAGASNRLYDFPYPIMRSGRFMNLADAPRVMQEDTEGALGEWEYRRDDSLSDATNTNGSPADECAGAVPAWQTRQRRPGNIAMTPPPISANNFCLVVEGPLRQERNPRTPPLNSLDVRTTSRERIVIGMPMGPGLLRRPFADQTRMDTPPIDLRTRRAPLQTPSEDRDKKLAGKTPPVDLKKTSTTPPPPPQQQQQQQQQQRLFGMGPPRSPGVLRTRVVSPLAPQRRHSQPSTAAPPLYAGLPPRRSSVPVRHLSGMANGSSNGTGLAEGGWASRHACENEDCRSFWQHLQECGLQLPPGWYVMQHEDARGRPYAYVVQLDVGPRDMVPNLARSIMIDQHGRMQYFMYGAPVDASDNSLPEELNDLASLNEIVDVFASMNHEF